MISLNTGVENIRHLQNNRDFQGLFTSGKTSVREEIVSLRIPDRTNPKKTEIISRAGFSETD